jgi:hypothetical protein
VLFNAAGTRGLDLRARLETQPAAGATLGKGRTLAAHRMQSDEPISLGLSVSGWQRVEKAMSNAR